MENEIIFFLQFIARTKIKFALIQIEWKKRTTKKCDDYYTLITYMCYILVLALFRYIHI